MPRAPRVRSRQPMDSTTALAFHRRSPARVAAVTTLSGVISTTEALVMHRIPSSSASRIKRWAYSGPLRVV